MCRIWKLFWGKGRRKRLDESLSCSIIRKSLYGTAGYEIDISKIKISDSGNVQPADKGDQK